MDEELRAASTLARRVGLLIRSVRLARGESLGDVARASGLSKTILARIERGEGNPSLDTLWRISQAMDVPLGTLVADPGERPRTRVVRAGGGEALPGDEGMEASLLHAVRGEFRPEFYALGFRRGVEQRREAHLPGTEEVIVCVSGVLLAGPLGEEAELRAGDALWFTADVPHRYLARRDARALGAMLYAKGAG